MPQSPEGHIQYLNSALSARGASAVPYNDSEKWGIRDQVVELLKVYPTLGCIVDQFHGNDGRTLNLLKVDGTIPIHFQGGKYNIPIIIWMLEMYPYEAPSVYVVPTPTMLIKSPHSYVDRSGQVSSPKLQSWQYPISNLVDVVLEMSQLFSREPPLFAQPAGTARQPVPLPPPHNAAHSRPAQQQPAYNGQHFGRPDSMHRHNESHRPPQPPPPPPPQQPASGVSSSGPSETRNPMWDATHGGSSFGLSDSRKRDTPTHGDRDGGAVASASAWRPDGPAAAAGGAQQHRPTATGAPTVSTAELESQFRVLALEALSRQVQAGFSGCARRCEADMTKALEVQRTLTMRRTALEQQREALKRERMGTEGAVGEMGNHTRSLTQWLERNEARASDVDPAALDVDHVFVAADSLTRQVLAAQAEDLALEDVVSALDKAVQGGQLTADVYIKQVRAVCRQQFFVRALGIKVGQMMPQPPKPPPPPTRAEADPSQRPYPPLPPSSQSSGRHPAAGGPSPASDLHSYPLPPDSDVWSSTSGTANSGMLHNPLSSSSRS